MANVGCKCAKISDFKGGGEVQSLLNQKLSSKHLRAVDFASRFVLSIKFKFKIHTFDNYYKSRCKINGSQRL
jgi:hypothetical protein